MSNTVPVIPLPEHLKHCGCPDADRNRHKTSCGPALYHDSQPLTEHPDYVEGGRFEAVTWDYPLCLTGSIQVEVDVDPLAYIWAHIDAYDQFEMDSYCQEWEKPIAFLSDQMSDGADLLGSPFGYPRSQSRIDADMDMVSEYPRWTPEDTDALNAALDERRREASATPLPFGETGGTP